MAGKRAVGSGESGLRWGWRSKLAGAVGLAALSVVVAASAWLVLGTVKGPSHPQREGLTPYTGGAHIPAVTLPPFVTPEARELYAFALERPDVLQYMPCYCGCGLQAGHRSNLDCYVAGVDPSGAVRFTDHAVF